MYLDLIQSLALRYELPKATSVCYREQLWGAPDFHTKLVSHNSIKNVAQKQWRQEVFVEEVWGHHWATQGRHSPGMWGVPSKSSLLQEEHPSKCKYLKSMKYQLHLPAPGHHKHTENLLNICVKPHFVPRPHRNTLQHTRLPQRWQEIPRGVYCTVPGWLYRPSNTKITILYKVTS